MCDLLLTQHFLIFYLVVVQFLGPQPREVWIPPSQRSQISVAKASDNSGEYVAPLKEILPLALAQDSPIKS